MQRDSMGFAAATCLLGINAQAGVSVADPADD